MTLLPGPDTLVGKVRQTQPVGETLGQELLYQVLLLSRGDLRQVSSLPPAILNQTLCTESIPEADPQSSPPELCPSPWVWWRSDNTSSRTAANYRDNWRQSSGSAERTVEGGVSTFPVRRGEEICFMFYQREEIRRSYKVTSSRHHVRR